MILITMSKYNGGHQDFCDYNSNYCMFLSLRTITFGMKNDDLAFDNLLEIQL